MIREPRALACAEEILAPFIATGVATKEVVPLVARIIMLASKEDELAQMQEHSFATQPLDYERSGRA